MRSDSVVRLAQTPKRKQSLPALDRCQTSYKTLSKQSINGLTGFSNPITLKNKQIKLVKASDTGDRPPSVKGPIKLKQPIRDMG